MGYTLCGTWCYTIKKRKMRMRSDFAAIIRGKCVQLIAVWSIHAFVFSMARCNGGLKNPTTDCPDGTDTWGLAAEGGARQIAIYRAELYPSRQATGAP